MNKLLFLTFITLVSFLAIKADIFIKTFHYETIDSSGIVDVKSDGSYCVEK